LKQAVDHSTPVSLRPVLPELPFPCEPHDRHFDADDRADQRRHEVFGGIGDLPRRWR
jgi:hypothetical protein